MQWYGVKGILFSFLAHSLASHDSCAFVVFIMQGENPTARLTTKERWKRTSQIQIIKKVIREAHIGHSKKNSIDGLLLLRHWPTYTTTATYTTRTTTTTTNAASTASNVEAAMKE
jgi:hypothetical protein